MKTLTLIPTLLALAIQVMVNGQTQGNQVRKIRMDIMGQKKQETTKPSPTIVFSSEVEIVNQTELELYPQFKNLNRFYNTTTFSMDLVNKIKSSEIKAQTTYTKFKSNHQLITNFFIKNNSQTTSHKIAVSENEYASYLIKIAKEIREEAFAQTTLPAVLAELSNAEENEKLAIEKQIQVFELLEKIDFHLLNNLSLMNSNSSEMKESTVSETKVALSKKENNTNEVATQSKKITQTIEALKLAVLESNGAEKVEILNEIKLLEVDLLKTEIANSNQLSKNNYSTFKTNDSIIQRFLATKSFPNQQKLYSLIDEAKQLMHLGKEIREEANAQFTLLATLGEMSNAEEKENSALQYQQTILNKMNFKMPETTLAIK